MSRLPNSNTTKKRKKNQPEKMNISGYIIVDIKKNSTLIVQTLRALFTNFLTPGKPANYVICWMIGCTS